MLLWITRKSRTHYEWLLRKKWKKINRTTNRILALGITPKTSKVDPLRRPIYSVFAQSSFTVKSAEGCYKNIWIYSIFSSIIHLLGRGTFKKVFQQVLARVVWVPLVWKRVVKSRNGLRTNAHRALTWTPHRAIFVHCSSLCSIFCIITRQAGPVNQPRPLDFFLCFGAV